MSLIRQSERDIKDSKAQSDQEHGRDVQNPQNERPAKNPDGTDVVMEQWKDVPSGNQKSDGSGERR
jgi:hypothetical protein